MTKKHRDIYAALPGLLLPWYAQNARVMPWRGEKNPYCVWLSEIMLQQTRVETVRGYYTRFLAALPDVAALACAPQEQLLKLWEGLGYYSRARNLQKAARQLQEQFGGVFPQTEEALQKLPGIGPYTAGAIASICFERPAPAVDGNVLRVLSRVTHDIRPIDSPQLKNEMTQSLAEVYPAGHCGDFTQALMELGAMVCLPNGAPLCGDCPLVALCLAHKNDCERTLPVKGEKKVRKKQCLAVFVLTHAGSLALRKRPPSGVLAGLWELPNTEGKLSPAEALRQAAQWGVQPKDLTKQLKRKHIFTHLEWEMDCFFLECARQNEDFTWVSRAVLAEEISLPTAFKKILEK